MPQSNSRKTIFITGAASGIGAETARLFAARGWFCGLYDINQEALAEISREIGGDNCHSARLDVRNREDWAAAIEGFGAATGGRMDVLFNNAGVGRHGAFEEISGDDNDWMIDINVKGVVNGIQAACPLLKATPGARVVNTASMAGMVGSPSVAVYSATKFAVRGLTEALDAEFAPHDITVTSLMPYFINTPILDMANSATGNHKLNDTIEEMGANVYPVSLAAERAWDAAHGKDIHYMVGKEAHRARLMQRLLPRFLHNQMKKRAIAER